MPWTALSILIVLLPAAYAGWSGRRLLRRPDDPLFAELHFTRYRRLRTAYLIAVPAGILVSGEGPWLKVLLALLALAVAEYGYRKRVFRETWSFLGYAGHYLRLVGLLGVWILVALAPDLVLWSGTAAVPVAIILAAVILGLSQLYAPLVRLLLGAAPLVHPDLEARFEKILARAACRPPAVLRAGPVGGFWLNAMAVPSAYRPAVVLSDDLLASLGPRETTAVFAHEVAHLEKHLRPARRDAAAAGGRGADPGEGARAAAAGDRAQARPIAFRAAGVLRRLSGLRPGIPGPPERLRGRARRRRLRLRRRRGGGRVRRRRAARRPGGGGRRRGLAPPAARRRAAGGDGGSPARSRRAAAAAGERG